MTPPICAHLVAFADGELGKCDAEAFRRHLVSCSGCQRELVEANQLAARLSTLPPRRPV